MTDIKSMNLGEMTDFFQEIGEPPFRAKQVFQWLHRGARSFDEMTNLSKALREKLAGTTTFIIAQRVTSVQDADRIIVLNDGRIDAVGTHEELLATNEIYREVYESQQKGVA